MLDRKEAEAVTPRRAGGHYTVGALWVRGGGAGGIDPRSPEYSHLRSGKEQRVVDASRTRNHMECQRLYIWSTNSSNRSYELELWRKRE